VVGACFCTPLSVSDELLALNLRISKPCCAKEILAPMLRAHRRSGRELHIQRAPTSRFAPLRSVPQQHFPTRAGSSKEEVAYHLRLSEIGLRPS
jgi:hypothetical protein